MPLIVTISAVGVFTTDNNIFNMWIMFVFGIIGYLMKKHAWPRIPLVVALLLGGGIELNLRITAQLHALGRVDLWARPLLLVLVLLVLVNLALPWLRASSAARQEPAS